MSEKVIDIKEKYGNEINEIEYILKNLENGRYYENSQAKMDGYLANNIIKLREKLNDIFSKIEYNKDSIDDEIFDAVFKIEE